MFGVEDANGMMEVACCWLPRPRSAAPQSAYRGGQVALYGVTMPKHGSGPSSCLVPPMSGVTGWHLRQGRPGSRFPVGRCTLHVLHQVMPQPSHHLLGACLPLMGPFRSMLLPSQSGLQRFAPRAHRVPVDPKVFPHASTPLSRRTARHGAEAGGCRLHALVRPSRLVYYCGHFKNHQCCSCLPLWGSLWPS